MPFITTDQVIGVLNFDADVIWNVPANLSGLADSIDNALDVQFPVRLPPVLHLASHGDYDLAALRDARDGVNAEIAITAAELCALNATVDWNSSLVVLSACETASRDSAENLSLAIAPIPGTPFNARALRLLKKLAVLCNWSRFIDHAISVIVRCSKRRRRFASHFLSEIRWHLVHGCHPPDCKPVHVSSHSRLGCAA